MVADITQSFSCQCGCGMNLAFCNHVECGFRDKVQPRIAAMVKAGVTSEQIVDAMVREYGAVVLAKPPQEGFFLLAWYAPILFFLIGGIVIMKWLKRTANAPHWQETLLAIESATRTATATTSETREALQSEQRRLLTALEELDFDYHLGKLSTADYEVLQADYRAQALAVKQQLDRL